MGLERFQIVHFANNNPKRTHYACKSLINDRDANTMMIEIVDCKQCLELLRGSTKVDCRTNVRADRRLDEMAKRELRSDKKNLRRANARAF